MFDISFGELLLILVVALVVLGPEKLPKVAYKIGQLIQKFKKYQWDFQQQFQKLEQFQALQQLNEIKEIQELKNDVNDLNNLNDFTSYHSYNSSLHQATPSYYPRKLKKNLAIRLSPALINRIKRSGIVKLKKLRKTI